MRKGIIALATIASIAAATGLATPASARDHWDRGYRGHDHGWHDRGGWGHGRWGHDRWDHRRWHDDRRWHHDRYARYGYGYDYDRAYPGYYGW